MENLGRTEPDLQLRTTLCQVLRRPLAMVVLLIAGLLFLAPGIEANAIVPSIAVLPGGPAVSPPLTSAAAGTLLAALDAPFSFTTTSGTTSGDILSAVYQNPSGTLDFYYQVFNSASSATSLARESDTSFTGFATSVAFRLDGGSLASSGFTNGTPGIVPVTADRDPSGSVVGFNFTPTPRIPAGDTSAVLIISTDATKFTAGNAAVIDGGSQTVAAFQPSGTPLGTVPEPNYVGLMVVGLIAFTGIRRLRLL